MTRPNPAVPTVGTGPHRERIDDVEAAEAVLSEAFVDHRLDLGGSGGPLDARMEAARFGDLTAGRISYGRTARLTCLEPLQKVHLDLVLAGRAVLTDGLGGRTEATVGRGAVYMPGSRPVNDLSADCVLMAMCVPTESLEREVTTLLGQRPDEQLRFAFVLGLDDEAGRRLRMVLDLVLAEVGAPVLGRLDRADRQLESLVLASLLAAQPHNHREAVLAQGPATGSVVHRAAELVQADPGRPWTTSRLAAEVHLSVRSLQEGFSRELGVAPMPYVRQVRLQRVRHALLHATEGTTVGAVAARFGFAHLGRFAGHYVSRFGELPSTTLSRARAERAG